MKNNIRSFAIWTYLTAFRLIFMIMNMFPVKRKVTFIVSFGDNAIYLYEELKRQQISCEVVFLFNKSCKYNFSKYEDAKAIPLNTANLMQLAKSIYHIATSKTIIIDNYYAFLSVIHFKKEVKCIQVWHAAGAFKKFGLHDHSLKMRTNRDIKRFKNVYKRFHYVAIGSDIMGNIFMEAFGLSPNQLLYTGIPRTDIFYDEKRKMDIMQKLLREYPDLRHKKRILYAPTFRDEQLDLFEFKLNLDLMKQKLGKDYIVMLRLHPAIKHKLDMESKYHDFVVDLSTYHNVNELLMITDILITDYSSIPFEYALLKRPMIFYAYDLEAYGQERGLWYDYKEMIPGPVVSSTEDIIEQILNNSYDMQRIEQFSNDWNKYSVGSSSSQLIRYIRPTLETEERSPNYPESV
ncbi:CDP-glycerol glycerophosphotransferase family protein [Bacillus sp. FJAT-49736]|uniref:CDP-glycerol glycerophosphotransferase family protein n=1 Tax=Bacillus sp. FJAT-49736 TaxID=2833582 RepID=UPI001BC964D8|nr:CDP-glycerol glycerophosphotransferase family protein [Bacillus sp. FJAT-49736]MBS4174053.1 CDP-glycerol glycerophosphotransferase family protein [Bacillus sp. FJAT-49736]